MKKITKNKFSRILTLFFILVVLIIGVASATISTFAAEPNPTLNLGEISGVNFPTNSSGSFSGRIDFNSTKPGYGTIQVKDLKDGTWLKLCLKQAGITTLKVDCSGHYWDDTTQSGRAKSMQDTPKKYYKVTWNSKTTGNNSVINFQILLSDDNRYSVPWTTNKEQHEWSYTVTYQPYYTSLLAKVDGETIHQETYSRAQWETNGKRHWENFLMELKSKTTVSGFYGYDGERNFRQTGTLPPKSPPSQSTTSKGTVKYTWETSNHTQIYRRDIKATRSLYGTASFDKSVTTVNGGNGNVDVTKFTRNGTTWINDCYGDIKTAKYHIYTDASCKSEYWVKTITANGSKYDFKEGKYYLKESQVATPTGYYTDKTIHSFTVTSGKNTSVKVYDTPMLDPVQVLLQKVDKEGNVSSRLAGAEYTVRYYPGSSTTNYPVRRIWYLKTDATGKIKMDEAHKNPNKTSDSFFYGRDTRVAIPWGTVTIEETKAPPGFVLNPEIKTFTIKEGLLNSFASTNLITDDERKVIEPECGGISIKKIDKTTGKALPGVTFGVYTDKTCKKRVASVITDKDGVAYYGGKTFPFALSPETTYYFKEISAPILPAPRKYIISNKVYPVTVVEGTNTLAKDIAVNEEYGSVAIKKVDAVTGEPLANAVFTVYTDKECTQKAIDYLPNSTTITLKNPVTSRSSDGLARYGMYTDSNKNERYALVSGKTYYFKETTPPSKNYMPTEEIFPIKVKSGEMVIKTVPNSQKGRVTIEKVDQSGNSLEGVQFTIYTDAKCTQKAYIKIPKDTVPSSTASSLPTYFPNPITSGKNGLAEFGVYELNNGDKIYGLVPGATYYVKETKGKSGYALSTEIKTVKAASANDNDVAKFVKFTNDAFGGIGIKKVTDDGRPLEGTVFGVYSDSECKNLVSEMTTQSDGWAKYGYDEVHKRWLLTPKTTYYVKETRAPKGYYPSSEKFSQYIYPNKYNLISKPVTNVKAGAIKIQKIDAVTKKPLANAVFTVYTDKNCTQVAKEYNPITGKLLPNKIKTDESGWAEYGVYTDNNKTFYALKHGTVYYLKETTTPSIEYMPTDTVYAVTVRKGEMVPVSKPFPNTRKGAISIQKTDVNGNPLQGAEYTVYLDTACTKLSSIVIPNTDIKLDNPIITDENGIAEYGTATVDGKKVLLMQPGLTYVVKETKAPKGYVLDTEKYLVKIESGKIKPVTTIPLVNKEPTGKIGITKVGSVFSGATKGTIAINGENVTTYTPTYSTKNLAGATVEIRAKENIYTLKGTKIYSKDQLVDTIVTTIGTTYSKELPLGKYYVKEIKAPNGYVLSSETIDAAITADNNSIVVNPTIRLTNKRTGMSLILRKAVANPTFTTNADGTTSVILDKKPGAGFLFGIFAEDAFSVNGVEVIPKDGLILTGRTDQNGVLKFTKILPFGKYYAKELALPPNPQYAWIMDDSEYPINLTSETIKNESIVVEVFEDLKDNELVNDTSSVKISKKDLATGKGVAGALISIKDSKNKEVFRGYTKASGDTEKIYLPVGTYTFEEVEAPKGYIRNEQTFKFTVNADGTVSGTQRFTNEQIPGIKTKAMYADGTKDSVGKKNMTVIDNVTLTNLVIGNTYTVKGTLVNQNDIGTVISTGETTFKATARNMTVDVTFKFDGSELAGTTNVVFEDLFRNGEKIATHTDANDKEQIVRITDVKTAVSESVFAAKDVLTLTDTVTYSHFTPGNTYRAEGILIDKNTNNPLLIDGEKVTSSKEFTPTKEDGTIAMSFTFDTKDLANKTLVVFEKVIDVNTGVVIGSHENINDTRQTITFPQIKTTAMFENGDKESMTSKTTTVVDKVNATNLMPGKEYTINGTLVNADFENDIIATASTTFTASAKNMTVDIIFRFDSSELEGKSVVVFEDLLYKKTVVATHAEIDDKNQTVVFPSARTKVMTSEILAGETNLTDTVIFTNLIKGEKYTAKGILVDTSGNPIKVNGKTVVSETAFIPENADGTVDVQFAFDASSFAGKDIIVFEEIVNAKGNVIAVHKDVADTNQTVGIPKIKTKTAESTMLAMDNITLVDNLSYENLTSGNVYKVIGTIINKETGKPIAVDGKEVTSELEFIPQNKTGTVPISFTFNAQSLAGQSVVVFEKVFDVNTNSLIGLHEDLNDSNQTVDFPKIETEATFEDGDKSSLPLEKTTVIDKIKASNLTIGKEYTANGMLVNAKNETDVIATASTTFTATKKNMIIDVKFMFDATKLEGESIVVFETLKHNDKIVATHSDINDKNQTVVFPGAATKVSEFETFADEITLVDNVIYTNLIPGEKYMARGVLVDSTGNPILIDGREVTSTTEFIPTEANGQVDVTFSLNAKTLAGKTIIAFEEIVNTKGKVIAVHKDLNDTNQTTKITEVKTKASENILNASGTVTVTDTVTYKNFTVGNSYKVTGVLIDKSTGNPIVVNGKEVASEKEFKCEKENGSIKVDFVFDASELAGKSLVIFERVINTNTDAVIGIHEDLNDSNQTVTFPKVKTTAMFANNEKEGVASKDTVIIDYVRATNLIVGNEYTVKGTLVNVNDANDIIATAETTFKADKKDMTVEVRFEFDARKLEGESVVVFEDLFHNNKKVGTHSEINDEDQTVHFPKIRTKVRESELLAGEITLTDTVYYENLTPNADYIARGILVDKRGNPVTVDGKEISSEIKFTPEENNGNVSVEFRFNAKALEGTDVVVFEEIHSIKGILVAEHKDTKDTNQTVGIPKIRTKTSESIMNAIDNVTLVDTITYENLTVGTTYKATGTLVDKETGAPLNVTTEVEFTPEKENGTVDAVFTFDASELAGKTIVVFEKVVNGNADMIVGVHEDLNDSNQTVTFPKVKTAAMFANNEKEGVASKDTVIIDYVRATNLIVGNEYTVKGTLVNVNDANDIIATAETTFKADKKDMTVEVRFEFDARKLEGESVVVFEDLFHNNKKVGTHSEINDEDQTVKFTDAKTRVGEVELFAGEVTLTDTIAYRNLTVGTEYTARGILVDKAGTPIKANDREITSETKFIPEKTEGTVNVEFKFNAKVLEGTDIVVFEEILNAKGAVVAEHKDTSDTNQTATVIKVRTSVSDAEILPKEVKLTDTISYEGLTVGNTYTAKGVLVDKMGVPVKVNDQEITAETTFKAEKRNSTVDVTFTFDAKAFAGQTLVVFEELFDVNGKLIAEHKDTNDENQTIHVTEIRTKVGEAILNAGKVTLTDTISYKGLIIGETYTASGILVDKTGTPVRINEKEITAKTKFTAETTDGTIDVVFKFDAKALEGTDIVVFEEIINSKGIVVGEHKDTEDKDQTTTVTKARTKVGQAVLDAGMVTLTDTISYEGLIAGETYTARGVLVNQKGKPIKVEGEIITSEAKFTAKDRNGTVDVVFTFNAKALEGQSIVIFEEILDAKGTIVAEHKDANDKDQTTTITKLRTKIAKLHMDVNNDITLTDVIYYEGLTIGERYSVKGCLVDKTGKPILVNGKEVTSQTEFTANESGKVEVVFKFNGKDLKGKDVVVFEECYDTQGNLVGHHKDTTDKKQTITIPDIPGTKTPNTGDDVNFLMYTLLLSLSLLGLVTAAIRRKRLNA